MSNKHQTITTGTTPYPLLKMDLQTPIPPNTHNSDKESSHLPLHRYYPFPPFPDEKVRIVWRGSGDLTRWQEHNWQWIPVGGEGESQGSPSKKEEMALEILLILPKDSWRRLDEDKWRDSLLQDRWPNPLGIPAIICLSQDLLSQGSPGQGSMPQDLQDRNLHHVVSCPRELQCKESFVHISSLSDKEWNFLPQQYNVKCLWSTPLSL